MKLLVTIQRKMNIANYRMLCPLYKIGPLHLNKFYSLSPQISIFWKHMHRMAYFVRITAKLNYTAFFHCENVVLFQKKLCKHGLISQHVLLREETFGFQ